MESLSIIIRNLNESSYFSGIMMLLLNIGSKYVVMEISDSQEQFFSNIIIRRILVFTIFFTATRDIYKSFILTAIFIIFVTGLFNEKSKYCILPKHMTFVPKEGRTISNKEIEYAKEVLEIANDQKKEKDKYLNDLDTKKKNDKINYQNNLRMLNLYT